jgi:hypothetical protein
MQRLLNLTATFTLLFLLSASQTTFGRIGDTLQQCKDRYGKATPFGSGYIFAGEDKMITCFFTKNVCTFIMYQSANEKHTHDEIMAILKENSSGNQEWKAFAENGWTRSDIVIAINDHEGILALVMPKENPVRAALNTIPEVEQTKNDIAFSDDAFARIIEFRINHQKQKVFDVLHPTGTAKKIVVHECKMEWKTPKPTDNLEDMTKFTLRYTLYWEGPVEKDGYTKISTTFDNEVKRYTETQVLATNGVTNKEISQGMMYLGTELLKGMMQRRQQ